MTADELDRLEELWARNVRTVDIADELGYSPATVSGQVRRDRRRFPYRRKRVDVDEARLRMWCYRIAAGRTTIRKVAEMFGIDRRSVCYRMRKWGFIDE